MIINRADLTKFSGQHLIIIPIRSFYGSKSRLSPTFDELQRSRIMRFCAGIVLGATKEAPTVVITSDPEVQSFASERGKYVLADPNRGLNFAINKIYCHAGLCGVSHVTIAHGDLPLASDLTKFARPATLTIVPDRHKAGTNLISLPTNCQFQFCFGHGSFHKHQTAADSSGLAISVVEDSNLMIDIDTTDDLKTLAKCSSINFFDASIFTN